jgi:gliding motility-associated-like protein
VKKKQLFYTLAFLILFASLSSHAQVTADFTISDTAGCTPLLVQFTNTGSTGPEYEFLWYFGTLATSTDENPIYNFNNPGDSIVKLVITNTNTLEKDSLTKIISVTRTPNANLIIDSTNACVGGIVEFRNSSTKLSAYLDFGDGNKSAEVSNFIFHAYYAHGSYPIQYIAYNGECSDTSNYSITINGPIADFSVDPEEACKGTPIMFTLGDTTDVNSFSWNTDDGSILTGDSAVHAYDTMGYFNPKLIVNGANGTCTIEDTIQIYVVDASFTVSAERFCDQETVIFQNTSTENDFNYWNFGNGNTSRDEHQEQVYSPGTYNVSLKIESNQNCSDSITQALVIYPDPDLQFGPATAVCPGESATLSASGGHVIIWSPANDFDDPTSYNPLVTPLSTTTYSATITDTLTHCIRSGEIIVYVQEGFIPDMITVLPIDTSIIIGDTVQVNLFDSLNRELIYLWTPDVKISCTNCPNPILQPLQTTTYMLEVSDTNQCYSSELFEILINVTEEYRLGVPEAFTPNEDGVNDLIKVNGWGIKELLEFRIYNRWGNEVFFTDDINQGWDGTFNGKPQSIDSYAYIIKAEMWNDKVVIEKGTFSLLR